MVNLSPAPQPSTAIVRRAIGLFFFACLLAFAPAAQAQTGRTYLMYDGLERDGSLLMGRMTKEGPYYRFTGYVGDLNSPSPRFIAATGLFRFDEDEHTMELVPGTGRRLFEPDWSGAGLNTTGNPHIVGYTNTGDGTPFHAFVYSLDDDTFEDLGALDGNPFAASYATDASNDASVVVGYSALASNPSTPSVLDGQHAFVWTPTGGMVDLGSGDGPGGMSRAFGVSGDGTIIVGESEFAGTANHAFRWTQGAGFQDLGTLPGLGGLSFATAITRDGTTIIGGSGHAFKWTQGTGMVDLGALPGHDYSVATAISENGRVIVGDSSNTSLEPLRPGGQINYSVDSRAFRWTEATGIADLTTLLVAGGTDMTGITVIAATGISADGQYISGAITTPDTDPGEWVGALIKYCDDAIDACDMGITTPGAQASSVADLAMAQSAAQTHLGGTAGLLLGSLDPPAAGSELGGFAGLGSFSAGVKGRWVGDNVTLQGGFAFTQQGYGAVEINRALLGAASIRHTWLDVGPWQPFVEAGGWLAPGLDLTFTRSYPGGTGVGQTTGLAASVFAKGGVLWSPRPDLDIALAATFTSNWLSTAGYAEPADPANLFPATFGPGTTASEEVKLSLSVTAALTERVDLTVMGAVGYAVQSGAVSGTVSGLGTLSATAPNHVVGELGARVGVRVTDALTIHGLVLATMGQGIETHWTAGAGLSLSF